MVSDIKQARPTIVTDTREKKRLVFKKLAERRTNAILDRMRILGNLANRSAYEYSDDDVRKIFRAIEAEVKRTKEKFGDTRKRRFAL